MDLNYPIEIFKNGVLIETQTTSPWADNSLSYFDSPQLINPISVDFNDELMFVCHYPGDTYPNDDTVRVTIPSEINTPTSTSSTLQLVLDDDMFFSIRDSDGNYIINNSQQTQVDLTVDSCYSIRFTNVHLGNGLLKDTNGIELFSFQQGDFGNEVYSNWIHFNVGDNTVSIEQQHQALSKTLLSALYYDLNGRLLSISKKSDLPQGVYIERLHYSDGTTHTKKRIKF